MTECAAQRALRTIGVFLDEPDALGDVPALLAAIQRQVDAGRILPRLLSVAEVRRLEDLRPVGDPMPTTKAIPPPEPWPGPATNGAPAPGSPAAVLQVLDRRLRRRKVPADAARQVQLLREASLELEVELGRMALSAGAANDDPAREVERLALAIAEGAILIALSARAKAARAPELPSAAREDSR